RSVSPGRARRHEHAARFAHCAGLRAIGTQGAGSRGHTRRDLAQALGQSHVQPDQRTDALDAARHLPPCGDTRACGRHDARGAKRGGKALHHVSCLAREAHRRCREGRSSQDVDAAGHRGRPGTRDRGPGRVGGRAGAPHRHADAAHRRGVRARAIARATRHARCARCRGGDRPARGGATRRGLAERLRRGIMPRMKAIEAAVQVLLREGVSTAFGVPGAAINPLYAALRECGGIRHVLARHVEAASHMAEGYTRARAGNIGVCIGTSGPAGTDMITGLYSASADSIPILCITGQAPRARLHKEDFQAVDIEAIAKPVTKWAVTVREPALVPRAFQQAFHLMRSGRPGPVLIDLPVDVQMAEIEFDIDTYAPLPPYKPAATRAQIARALDMLSQSQRPLIVAGGGIINADASDLLVEFAEIAGVPVIPTLMGWGAIPDAHPLMAGMAGLQTQHRYGNANFLASDFVLGIGNRWANRHTGSTDVYTRGRAFVHIDIEPTQIGRVFCPDLGIVSDARAALELLVEMARERRRNGVLPRWNQWATSCRERRHRLQRRTAYDDVPIKPQRVYAEMNRVFGDDVSYV